MRKVTGLFLALGLLTGSVAHAQANIENFPPPAEQAAPVESSLADGAQARHQALARLAPELKVERIKTTPAKCVADVKQALVDGAYQVFVERQNMGPSLVPLEFNVVLRETVDVKRLAPVCQVATSLVVTRFSDKVKTSKDPQVQRDYVVALMMADWIQSKADGASLLGQEIPADAVPDPFGVLQAKPKVE